MPRFLLAVLAPLAGAEPAGAAEVGNGTVPTATWDDTDVAGVEDEDATIVVDCINASPASAADCDMSLRTRRNGNFETFLDLGLSQIFTQDATPIEVDQRSVSIPGQDFVVPTPRQLTLRNTVPAQEVELIFQDFADTVTDDMNHAFISVDCTSVAKNAENCDFRVGVTEGGGTGTPQRPEIRFAIDADAGIVLGTASNDSFTVITDGTGDLEAVLPPRSIGSGESMILTESIEFCGNGPPGPTIFTRYLGPSLNNGKNHTFEVSDGTPSCHDQESATEETADRVVFRGNVNAVGMVCSVSPAGPSGSVVSYYLRDDKAYVGGLYCTTTLDGVKRGVSGHQGRSTRHRERLAAHRRRHVRTRTSRRRKGELYPFRHALSPRLGVGRERGRRMEACHDASFFEQLCSRPSRSPRRFRTRVPSPRSSSRFAMR